MKKLFKKECAASFDEPIAIDYGQISGVEPIYENNEVPDDPGHKGGCWTNHYEAFCVGVKVSYISALSHEAFKVEIRGAQAARFLKGYGEYLEAQNEKKANLEKGDKK